MSARLSQAAADTVKHATKHLLNRMIKTCDPFDVLFGDGAANRVWDASLPPHVVEALNMLRKNDAHGGEELFEVRAWAQLPVRLPSGRVYALLLWQSRQEPFLAWAHQAPVEAGVLGLDIDRLTCWLEQHDHINRVVQGSIETIEDLVGMASTVGQVVRMAPDLEKYIPPAKLATFREQTVKSPFPRNFTSYDRSWVRHMQQTLAHCYLLPQQGGNYQHPDEIMAPWCCQKTSALRVTWRRGSVEDLPGAGKQASLWNPVDYRYDIRFGHDTA